MDDDGRVREGRGARHRGHRAHDRAAEGRPRAEIAQLLRRAKEKAASNRVLACVACAESAASARARGEGRRVDYDRLLKLTERHLETAIRQAVLLPRPSARPLVLVYGGALHNDLYPARALAPYAFGPAIFALLHGDYREVDLYVPEFVERLAAMRAEPWFAPWQARARPTETVVIPRSARSTIVVFPRAK